MPFDARKRREYLDKYKQRGFVSKQRRQHNVLALKVKFSHQQRSLNLRARATGLINALRADIGEDFLKDVRVVMASQVHRNAFVASYAAAMP